MYLQLKTFLLALLLLNGVPEKKASLYLIGDSTMAGKTADKYPETGWGQVLPSFFSSEIIIKNHAVNGRSTKSFIEEGRWRALVDSLHKGDYVCIQFAHNDEKSDDSLRFTNPVTAYRSNLIRFITETREKGAFPILITPIVRRNFNEEGVLVDTHGLYALVIHEVSLEYNVPLIDLQLLTEELVILLGEESSKKLFNWLDPGEHANYPEGKQDNTHLNRTGAMEVARLFVQEVEKQDLGLNNYIK
jgi:lysophospholipase L1-like esterase